MAPQVVALMVLGLTAVVARQGQAQGEIRASQHGTVSQRVGYTDISVTYNRPVARGRTLFGEVVNGVGSGPRGRTQPRSLRSAGTWSWRGSH